MKENSLLKLKLYGLFLFKQHFPSFIFSWEKQTRPVCIMFIMIVILTDLFCCCCCLWNSSSSYTRLMSHHNCGFCNDMLFYCIIQASIRASKNCNIHSKLKPFNLKFQANQNSKLYWQCVLLSLLKYVEFSKKKDRIFKGEHFCLYEVG